MDEADKRDDIKIEGDVATWDISAVGNIKGTYIGTFKFRCFLTPLQQISAGREERALVGENFAFAPEHERFMAYALTQLKYRILSAPPFWASANPNGNIQGDLPDTEIVSLVLGSAIDAEVKYKNEIKYRKEAAIERAKKANDTIIAAQREEAELNGERD
jgi:hypothetical protein